LLFKSNIKLDIATLQIHPNIAEIREIVEECRQYLTHKAEKPEHDSLRLLHRD
jgi:hypothetical protein